MTVERHYTGNPRASDGPGEGTLRPPVMEAEAVAAMTCPGAIPLKTAQRGVTIKRDGHIRRSSPHEAGGGTRQELTIKAKMPFVSSSADERKMDF